MEKQLQDNLKLVADWYEEKNITKKHLRLYYEDFYCYDDDWSKQIPVWAKLVLDGHVSGGMYGHYMKAVSNDNPRAGFDLLVSIIKRIKQ